MEDYSLASFLHSKVEYICLTVPPLVGITDLTPSIPQEGCLCRWSLTVTMAFPSLHVAEPTILENSL